MSKPEMNATAHQPFHPSVPSVIRKAEPLLIRFFFWQDTLVPYF